VFTGIGIACASWLFLLLTFILILIVVSVSPIEEKETIKHYGEPYEDYMKRTPKWIGIPKFRKNP
jgi:protein-S-isoprenylcysteine O-methyltransferase Ste14